jgi:hypothetical protein
LMQEGDLWEDVRRPHLYEPYIRAIRECVTGNANDTLKLVLSGMLISYNYMLCLDMIFKYYHGEYELVSVLLDCCLIICKSF